MQRILPEAVVNQDLHRQICSPLREGHQAKRRLPDQNAFDLTAAGEDVSADAWAGKSGNWSHM